MDLDEPLATEMEEPTTEDDEPSPRSEGYVSDSKMDEDEEEDLEEPKPKKKRGRSSMTPSTSDGKKRLHLPRTIAVKRSASAEMMASDDEDDENGVTTPRRVNRGRSDRSLSSRKSSSSAGVDDGISSRLSSKSNLTDATEEFGESLSRPPRKKTKQSEPAPADFVSRSSSSPLHQTRSPMSNQPQAASEKPKTPSVFSFNFLSKLLPARSTPSTQQQANVQRDTSSEPTNEVRYVDEEEDDSISSPNVRANSSSAPHSVGSPAQVLHYPPPYTYYDPHAPQPREDAPVFGIQNIPYPGNYAFSPTGRPEFARPRSREHVEDSHDYIEARSPSNQFRSPVRSASGRYLNSPAASHSPTSYMGSPQAPASASVWGRQPIAVRSPSPPLQHDVHRRPIGHQGIHSPPANRRHHASEHAPFKPNSSASNPSKTQRSALMSDIIRALRNFLFLLLVCVLTGFVVWLFSGDIWRKIFGVNQERLHDECADRLKDILRSRAGEHECRQSMSATISAGELMVAKDAVCIPGDKPYDWNKLVNKLTADPEVVYVPSQDRHKDGYYYNGPNPTYPWSCLIRSGLVAIIKAYGIHIAGIASVFGLIQYAIFRFRRSRGDAIKARQIALDIVRDLQNESNNPKHGGSLVKDFLESDFASDAEGHRLWPLVVDIVESNARVQVVPKDHGGAQVQAWTWSSS